MHVNLWLSFKLLAQGFDQKTMIVFYHGSAPKDKGNKVKYNINKYKMLKIYTWSIDWH